MNNLINIIKNFILNIKEKFFYNLNKKEEIKEQTSNETKENIKLTNINWELIDKLKNYDIVFVKMDDESIKENNIIENKQKRPFIIKEKNNEFNNCSGYYLTSNLNHHYFFRKEINKGLKFILDYNKYSLSNNSLIAFNESYNLPYQNIIRYVESLDDLDKNRLEKYISILNGMQVTSNKENKLVEIGDIVLENNIYYIIYQVDNTNCYGYPIKPYNKYIDLSENFDYFMFDCKVYFVDYKNYKIFNLNENILITNRFNCDVVDKIKENKKIKKSKQKNRRKH